MATNDLRITTNGDKRLTTNKKVYEMQNTDVKAAVMALDVFCHIWCRDYSITDDLAFNCDRCNFKQANGVCLVKSFKCDKAPNYKDFGCMGDL